MQRSDLDALLADIGRRQPVALVSWLGDGRQLLVRPGDPLASPELAAAVAEAFRTDRSRIVRTGDGGEVFVHVHNPPLRMVLIGAVHIAQSLIPMARQAGYEIIVVDPRTAFATEDRFRDVTIDARWPDEALPGIGLDRRTAFVALTHDPKIDDPALTHALGSESFYIGALGSGRTHAKRVERLQAAGLDAEAIGRIHAPIGLDIGAIGAVEIAISIMAEVTACLRGKPVGRS